MSSSSCAAALRCEPQAPLASPMTLHGWLTTLLLLPQSACCSCANYCSIKWLRGNLRATSIIPRAPCTVQSLNSIFELPPPRCHTVHTSAAPRRRSNYHRGAVTPFPPPPHTALVLNIVPPAARTLDAANARTDGGRTAAPSKGSDGCGGCCGGGGGGSGAGGGGSAARSG